MAGVLNLIQEFKMFSDRFNVPCAEHIYTSGFIHARVAKSQCKFKFGILPTKKSLPAPSTAFRPTSACDVARNAAGACLETKD